MDNLLAIQNNYVHVKYITYTLHHLVFNRHACRRQTSEDRPRQTINARIKCTPTVDTFTSPSAYRSPRAATDVQCHRRCLETALFRANDLRLPKHGLLFKPTPSDPRPSTDSHLVERQLGRGNPSLRMFYATAEHSSALASLRMASLCSRPRTLRP